MTRRARTAEHLTRLFVSALAVLILCASSSAYALPVRPRNIGVRPASAFSLSASRRNNLRGRTFRLDRRALQRQQNTPQQVAHVVNTHAPTKRVNAPRVFKGPGNVVWNNKRDVLRAHYRTTQAQVVENLERSEQTARQNSIKSKVAYGTTIAMKVAGWAAVGYALLSGNDAMVQAAEQWAVPAFLAESGIAYLGHRWQQSAKAAREVATTIRDKFDHWIK